MTNAKDVANTVLYWVFLTAVSESPLPAANSTGHPLSLISTRSRPLRTSFTGDEEALRSVSAPSWVERP
ncbi:MAG: hypothetical protein WKH64_08320 [Chloroflexia bacterium]